MNKITFRIQPQPTGLWSVGNPHPATTIKLNKKEIGNINGPTWRTEDHKWSIWVRVIDKNDPEKKKWKNVRFKARFDDEASARVWFLENFDKISQTETFVPMED